MTKKTGTAGEATLPDEPGEVHDADVADPGAAAETAAEQRQTKTGRYGSSTIAGQSSEDESSSEDEQSEEQTEEPSWLSFALKLEDGSPVPDEPYRVKLGDGSIKEGRTDSEGLVRIEGIKPGSCEITFPRIDKGEWRKE